LDREDLATLRPVIFNILTTRKGLVAGSGIIVAPDVLRDAPRWLEWWWTTPAGTPEALRINLDPTAPDFFDYTTADWYATPARTLGRRVSGPYVDYVCTNAYSITLATPVCHAGRLLGMSAADVLISSLEQRVLPVLTAIPRPVLLASGDGRVIASSSPRWAPGMSVVLEQSSTVDAVSVGAGASAAGGDSSPRSWVLVDLDA
jgi:Methyl-accepting chemotaxis protein-like, first PDC sensor domain